MSADNWAICPQCKLNDDKIYEKSVLDVGKAYGTVTPEEFLEMVENTKKRQELPTSFREDYDIGVTEEGTFIVNYRGHCRECDCGFDYKFEQRIPLK